MTVEIDEAKLEELLSMYQQGVPVADIAKELDLTISRVRKALTAHGQKRSRSAPRADEAEICEAYAFGEVVAGILEKHEITYPMLYTILARHGVPIRKVAQQTGRKLMMDQAVDMYLAGVPLWKIRADTGVQQPQLHAELHSRGVALRRPRKMEDAHEQPKQGKGIETPDPSTAGRQ